MCDETDKPITSITSYIVKNEVIIYIQDRKYTFAATIHESHSPFGEFDFTVTKTAVFTVNSRCYDSYQAETVIIQREYHTDRLGGVLHDYTDEIEIVQGRDVIVTYHKQQLYLEKHPEL